MVELNEQQVARGPLRARVIEMGKSRQWWAGHYGPRFRKEQLAVTYYNSSRNWVRKLPVVQPSIDCNYHSLCNMGFGDSFNFEGVPLQKGYQFLTDCDLPHTQIINEPFTTEVSYDQVFTGGSSLKILKGSSKLLRVVIPARMDIKAEYWLVLTAKGTNSLVANMKYMSNNPQHRIFTLGAPVTQEVNGWMRYKFRLNTDLEQVKEDNRCLIDMASQEHPYWLGDVKIAREDSDWRPVPQSIITLSGDYQSTAYNYINVTI